MKYTISGYNPWTGNMGVFDVDFDTISEAWIYLQSVIAKGGYGRVIESPPYKLPTQS